MEGYMRCKEVEIALKEEVATIIEIILKSEASEIEIKSFFDILLLILYNQVDLNIKQYFINSYQQAIMQTTINGLMQCNFNFYLPISHQY